MNVCKQCDNEFKSIGIHWNKSSDCEHPSLSKEKRDIMIGGLMSDATLSFTNSSRSGRPTYRIFNTNKEFLEWISDKLGNISNGVKLSETGKEKHERNIESGFDNERDAEYKDLYELTTVSHPFNSKLHDWYSSGEKSYPEQLQITPTIAKVWYAGDGNLNWDGETKAYCEIGCNNESKNESKIVSFFENVGFKVHFSNGRIRFYGESKDFLNWMGKPPDGMEYKWETESRVKYDELRKI